MDFISLNTFIYQFLKKIGHFTLWFWVSSLYKQIDILKEEKNVNLLIILTHLFDIVKKKWAVQRSKTF